MRTVRVKAEFDLTITDDAAARELSAGFMRGTVQETVAGGGTVPADGQSPEVAVHGLAQEDKIVQSLIVREVLGRGADSLPFVTVSDLNVKHLS